MTKRKITTHPEARKAELIAGLVAVREKIVASASALPADKKETVFLGSWSVMDLLAHLAGWDLTNLEASKEIARGKLPSFYAHHDRDWATYNATLITEHKRGEFEAQLLELRDTHRELIAHLQSLPAEDLERDRGIRRRSYKVTLDGLLRAELNDEEEHLAQIEAFTESL
ncbi:MAG: ClbS/DfsB family four-helix bundle protein [Anaerolineales bacterium]|jgi:uncharacterized damage-inducible protein DinB